MAVLLAAARPILALDWGVSFDRTAAVLIYRLAGIHRLNPDHDGRPVFIAFPKIWPAGTLLGHVVDEVASWAIPYAYVAAETNGVGSGPSQMLYAALSGRSPAKRWNLAATTAASKTAGFGCVLGLLEGEQLV